MSATCTRCGRTLKAPTPTGMGPVCAAAVLGVKPKREKLPRLFDRARRARRDERTPDLFAGVAA